MNKDHAHRSTAAIFSHPLHPMLVPFPIAFLTALLASDIVYAVTGDEFWLRASYWLCVCGLVTAGAAAGLGAIDFFTIPRAKSLPAGWIHFLGNGAVFVITFLNAWLRWNDSPTVPWPWGIPLSACVVALLCATGWYGGELSYRYRIGVIPEEEDPNGCPSVSTGTRPPSAGRRQ